MATGTVAAIDVRFARGRPALLALNAAGDWAAHVATAHLLLAAVDGRDYLASEQWRPAVALLTSVAIDVDHVPYYLGADWTAVPDGRPFSHSLLTLVGLAAAAAAAPAPRREVLTAVAAGVVLHFSRDIATGPGLPLLWPVRWTSYRVRYRRYAVGVLAAAALAAARRR